MNINPVGANLGVLAALATKQSAQVKQINTEAKETAAQEASESRQVQVAEGEIGQIVSTYA